MVEANILRDERKEARLEANEWISVMRADSWDWARRGEDGCLEVE